MSKASLVSSRTAAWLRGEMAATSITTSGREIPRDLADTARGRFPTQFRMSLKSKTADEKITYTVHVARGFVNWDDRDIEVAAEDFPIELSKDMDKELVWEAFTSGVAGYLRMKDVEEEDAQTKTAAIARRLIGRVKAQVLRVVDGADGDILAPKLEQVKIDTIEIQEGDANKKYGGMAKRDEEGEKVNEEDEDDPFRRSVQLEKRGLQFYHFPVDTEGTSFIELFKVELDKDGKATGEIIPKNADAAKKYHMVTRKLDAPADPLDKNNLEVSYLPGVPYDWAEKEEEDDDDEDEDCRDRHPGIGNGSSGNPFDTGGDGRPDPNLGNGRPTGGDNSSDDDRDNHPGKSGPCY